MPKYPRPPRSVYGTTWSYYEIVILWNILGDDFVWFKLSTIAVEAPLHFGCAFFMCTGVETVKQSRNSIETNKELFHSLNAHCHNANK